MQSNYELKQRIYSFEPFIRNLINKHISINTYSFKHFLNYQDSFIRDYAHEIIEYLEKEKQEIEDQYCDSLSDVATFISLLNNISKVFQIAKSIQYQIDYENQIKTKLYNFIHEDIKKLSSSIKEAKENLNSFKINVYESTKCEQNLALYNEFHKVKFDSYGKIKSTLDEEKDKSAIHKINTIIMKDNVELEEIEYLNNLLNEYSNIVEQQKRSAYKQLEIQKNIVSGLKEKKESVWYRKNSRENNKGKKDCFDILNDFINQMSEISASLIVAVCFETNLFEVTVGGQTPEERHTIKLTSSYINGYRGYLKAWVRSLRYYLGKNHIKREEEC